MTNENKVLFRGFIAGLISKHIKEQGRTIRWLARKMNINENTLYSKLNNGGYFDAYDVLSIVHYLEIPIEEVLAYWDWTEQKEDK